MKFKKIFNKILIVDGSYMLHRGLHIPELFRLTSPDGRGSGGIFSFLKMLQHELKIDDDYFPIVTFDNGLSKRRVDIDPCYKRANERDNNNEILTPEQAKEDYVTQYREQRNVLVQILFTLGIPCIKMIKWEGDDIMYILSKISEKSMVLTDDRDMLQLLTEDCIVRRPMANETIYLDSFLENMGFSSVNDFIMYKAIKGDGSDNIPGSCKGVGDKTINDFIKLLKSYKDNYPSTESSMKEACDNIGIKYKKVFLNFDKERYEKNIQLVDLNLVEADNSIIDSMVALISNCKADVDYFSAMKIISGYGIKEISVDDIIDTVSRKYSNLLI